MFNIKRIGAVVAAAALVITLTACGGPKDDTNTAEPAQTTQSNPTSTSDGSSDDKPTSNDDYAWVGEVKPLLAELGWELDPKYPNIGCTTREATDPNYVAGWSRLCVPAMLFEGRSDLQLIYFSDGDGELQMRFGDIKDSSMSDTINPRAEDGVIPTAFTYPPAP